MTGGPSMLGAQHALRAAGLDLGASEALPALRAECARLARLLDERQVRTIGLAPAAEDVAVPAVALELGRALAARRALVAVLDAHAGWPCAAALAASATASGEHVVTTWVLEKLALLTPRSEDVTATRAPLEMLLAPAKAAFSRLIVDLTGYAELGEAVGAFELLDTVVLVARSGRTTMRQLERWSHVIPRDRDLGVLLTGA
jgi:hypothetical protein